MEVAIGNAAPPFQREVREWQRVDPNTGALLTGRLEADRWIRDHMNTYGKVVDSQKVSTPNGTHHTQRKQLEVLQARTATGGAMQVVRSQTVHTSSSRWNSSSKHNGMNGTTNFTSTHSSPLSFQHKKLHGETQPKTVTPYAPEPTLSASSSMNSTSSPSAATNCGVGGQHKQLDPNERETAALNSHGVLNRGKSVSNEDLADDDLEPCEWKRVSKIRRSLQYPKATSPAKYSSRPLDLPENLVSVSRIRQELENGRRLDRAMRNNHVDLAALDSILKGAPDPDHKSETKTPKKATFITAESLKEIRGKLRKLSDESLYKDDILVQNDDDEVKTNGQPPEGHINEHQSNMNESRTDAMQPSTYATHLATTTPSGGFVFRPKVSMANGNSNSLQSRNKIKDLATNEWHYRRKSYGFEKMTPPPESMTSRMEASTDSGIGRSGEIAASWSPTENTTRGTVITLAGGDDGKESLGKSTSVTLLSNGGSQINSVITPLRPNSIYFNGKQPSDDTKRHSIAVDESKYVKESVRRTFEPAKTSSIHINGSAVVDSKIDDDLKKGQKRVEFCKTEVHFAAESGRVNIIETDGKPPPTNNFRRRRRSSGGSIGSSYLEAIKSGVPLTHFGDSEQPSEQQKPAASIAPSEPDTFPTVTTTTVTTTATNGTKSPKEEEDDSNDEISLRGILKNKPIKPRPYHLGENIENSESLWGIRLRPVSTDCTLWTKDSSPAPKEELPIEKTPQQIRDESDCTSGFLSDSNDSVRSVAERVRLVEKLRSKESPTGFSTKVNLTSSQSFNWPIRENYKPRLSTAKADVIHSNLLSIPLHSPTNSLTKASPKIDAPHMNARPISPVKTTPIARKSLPTSDNKPISQEKPKSVQQEPLRLVSGTRKLRDHELSYFGVNTQRASNSVPTTNNETKKSTKTAKTETVSKWKWSEVADRQKNRTDKEPIYENLKYHSNPMSIIQRHPNYDRDQDILDELNRAADEILSSVSKNHEAEESKSRRRIQSKPLETITEVRASKPAKSVSRGVQVSRGSSEIVRRSGVARSSCRISSASSSESIPRQIPSSSVRASTHSSSSKSRHSTRSHEDSSSTRSSRRRVTSMTECRRLQRTNSRDNIPSQASSSEDVNEPRRPRRLKVKEKSESSVPESRRSSGSSKSSSSRRHLKVDAVPSRSSRSISDQHQKIRVKSGIVTTTSPRNGNWLLRESRIE